MTEKKKGRDAQASKPRKEADARGVIRAIEFQQDQYDAIDKAASVEGHTFGPWVRAAALEKAHRLGFWNPFVKGGPKKSEDNY